MKRVKKLLLFALIAVVSFPAVVNAYSVHQKGSYVNFYISNEEKNAGIPDTQAKGITGFVMADTDSAAERYIKTFLVGMAVDESSQHMNPDHQGYDNLTDLKSQFQAAYKSVENKPGTNEKFIGDLGESTDITKGIEILSKQDAMSLFSLEGTCDSGCNISVDSQKGEYGLFGPTILGNLEDALEAGEPLKYIALKDTEGNNAWVIELTYTANSNNEIDAISAATLKKIPFSEGRNKSFFVPVMYMDKTMECHETENAPICYICSGEYKWLVPGTEDAGCEAYPGKTTQAECLNEACYDCSGEYKWFQVGKQSDNCELIASINVKEKCAKPVKTGVEDYVLEFLIIISVAGLVMFVVRKNDLFKTI